MIFFKNISLKHLKSIVNFLKHKNIRLLILIGDIGSGKTTFIKHYLDNIEVTSPTFSIYHSYNWNKKTVLHYDLYRITSNLISHEMITNMLNNDLVFIEWGNIIYPIIKKYLTKNDFILYFKQNTCYIYEHDDNIDDII